MITIQNIKFYTVDEVAAMLQITPFTVRIYIKQGKIRAQRIGRPFLIPEQAINEFLNPPYTTDAQQEQEQSEERK